MTTWTTEQVRIMEGYRFSQAVSNHLIWQATHGDDDDVPNPVIEYTVDHLFRGLLEAAHTWALEIDKGDCTYVATEDDNFDCTRVTIRWAPQTVAGLLIGGPAGGTCYQFPSDLHRRGVVWQVVGPTDVITAPVIKKYYYQFDGWSETRRMWVYRVVASRGA